jgi:hypothetical protein
MPCYRDADVSYCIISDFVLVSGSDIEVVRELAPVVEWMSDLHIVLPKRRVLCDKSMYDGVSAAWF